MTRVIFLNVKTTGFKDPEIIQIGAYAWRSNNAYTWSVAPTTDISDTVENETGFSTEYGDLYHCGEKLDTTSLEDALDGFLDYLDDFNEQIVLAAHNARFHARLLVRDMMDCNYDDRFSSLIEGFCDTVELMRDRFPERVKEGKKFNLPALADEFLDKDLNSFYRTAHEDAEYLGDIMVQAGVWWWRIVRNADITIEDIKLSLRFSENKSSLLESPLGDSLTDYMIRKIARAGINWDVILQAYRDDRYDGVSDLLTGNSGYPFVTNNQNIIDEVEEAAHHYYY